MFCNDSATELLPWKNVLSLIFREFSCVFEEGGHWAVQVFVIKSLVKPFIEGSRKKLPNLSSIARLATSSNRLHH